ncbi:MAG: GcvT family protein [Alphaproteobacteria bacterium]|nr:GcvT family protein [Alphaproteobacteria bacterium]
MKSHARVVVVGGGVMGAGLLYHLTKEGWTDVVLVEKGELTSGSTWHAAGLIPHFIGSLNMAKAHVYASELYQRLEAETGQATGWHGCGAIRLATNQDEADWFHYVEGVLRCVGAECHLIGPNEVARLHPLLDVEGIVLGAYTPGDGHTDPAGSTMAMAAGARAGGAEIYLRNRVLDIVRRADGDWDVVTEQGTIVAEHVVNAAGGFSPRIGAMVGLEVPIVNIVHQYLVTENLDAVAALDKEPPVVRDPRASCYYRQEQQGLIIGPYETDGAQPWALDGIDWSFDTELLPPDIDRLVPWLELAAQRIPAFADAGIKRVVSGPITHTPDGGFLIGPAPGLRNFWMCCGAGIGITQGPGAGKYLAQWMVHGQTDINVREMEARRFGPWSLGDYSVAKAVDEYHQMYQVHYPGEFREAGRPVRTTPIYDKLAAAGAVFAETFGWERAKWFAAEGVEERYGFRRMNWFEPVAEECRAVRERVGVLDLSSFSKFDVSGRDAAAFLDRVIANRVPRRDGRVVLAHALTELGGIESEFTVTRFDERRFYLLSGAVAQIHDHDWLVQHREEGEEVAIADVTDDYGVLVVTGPRSRELLAKLTDADLGNDAFPWLSAGEIEVAGIPVRALRVSYVGELGWELHHPMDRMEALYDAVMAAGGEFGVANFGLYAVNSLRMEKAYKGWGSELTTELTPIEGGLDRFVDMDSPFIGREAVVERTRKGVDTRLVYLSVDAVDADAHGNEPVYAGERVVGLTTSGAYGYAVEQSIAFAFVEPDLAGPGTELEVAILGRRCAARVLEQPLYDPANRRLRA